MRQPAADLVRRLWHYCNVLRDDGLSYPDYVEQLTYLIFLKMAEEGHSSAVPRQYGWRSFAGQSATELHRHYSRVLQVLGQKNGTLGVIFRNAKNKIRDPKKLRLLVEELIGQTDWKALSPDVKGDAYEGLLEKNAQDTKSGAGQYFTPRALIDAIVECVDPRPGELICDPASGTGGFLLAAYAHIRDHNPHLSRSARRHLATKAIRGVELVEEVARLATMNLLLHGIGEDVQDRDVPILCADSLQQPPSFFADVVLTNPPFGTRGTVTFTQRGAKESAADDLVVVRPDFWVKTANKQLNFIQHVVAMLKPGGRAAMVLPDNVLFESGAATAVRRRVLETCSLHTLLRLPAGLFYAHGVKANVLFFDKPLPTGKPCKTIGVYDLRDKRVSLKTNPLQRRDLDDFVKCFVASRSSGHLLSDRWRSFAVADVLQNQECRLDLSWRVSSSLQRTEVQAQLGELANSIANDLQNALTQIALIGKTARKAQPQRRSRK